MPTTTVLLTLHGEQPVTLDSEELAAAIAAGPAALDDLVAQHFDALNTRTAVILPDGRTFPLAPFPLPDIRALALAVHRDALDSGSQSVTGSAERLLLALGITPDLIPPF